MLKNHWPLILCVLTGVFFVLPGLDDGYWHDEAYTLINFAGDWRKALFDYHVPNNHRLFSFVLWVWLQNISDDILQYSILLRLLPFIFFLGSIAAICELARRRGGNTAALCAGMLFACSHPVISFAAELRGYAFSWLFALGAFAALDRWRETERFRDIGKYLLSAWAAVLILPTNLLISAALAVWAALETASRRGWRETVQNYKKPLVFIGFLPLLGLLSFAPCAGQLSDSIRAAASMEHKVLCWHYLWAVFKDILWLLPLLLFRFYPAAAPQTPAAAVNAPAAPRPFSIPLFAAAVVAVPLLLALALPAAPNDRVLVAVLPLVFLGAGLLLGQTLEQCRGSFARAALPALILILLSTSWLRENFSREFAIADYGEGYAPSVHNIYDQFFNHNYAVPEIAAAIADQTKAAQCFVIYDGGDVYGMMFHIRMRRHIINAPTVWYQLMLEKPETIRRYRDLAAGCRLLIAVPDRKTANAAAAEMRKGIPYLVADCGYYKLFAAD